jgi:hypothetical protein
MGRRGSRLFARANLVWVVVSVDVPPIVVRGWEGMASSAGLGARGATTRPFALASRLMERNGGQLVATKLRMQYAGQAGGNFSNDARLP